MYNYDSSNNNSKVVPNRVQLITNVLICVYFYNMQKKRTSLLNNKTFRYESKWKLFNNLETKDSKEDSSHWLIQSQWYRTKYDCFFPQKDIYKENLNFST